MLSWSKQIEATECQHQLNTLLTLSSSSFKIRQTNFNYWMILTAGHWCKLTFCISVVIKTSDKGEIQLLERIVVDSSIHWTQSGHFHLNSCSDNLTRGNTVHLGRGMPADKKQLFLTGKYSRYLSKTTSQPAFNLLLGFYLHFISSQVACSHDQYFNSE